MYKFKIYRLHWFQKPTTINPISIYRPIFQKAEGGGEWHPSVRPFHYILL